MTQYGPGERSKKEGANEGTPSQKLHMPMLSTKVGCVWGIVTAIAVRTLWRMLAVTWSDFVAESVPVLLEMEKVIVRRAVQGLSLVFWYLTARRTDW